MPQRRQVLVVLLLGLLNSGHTPACEPHHVVHRGEGDVRLPAVFGSNMVLQRHQPITIWGWADPGQTVSVSVANRFGVAVAQSDGKWSINLEPLDEGGPHYMTVSGKRTFVLENILVGEVWICSGQSNMELTVAQSDRAQEELGAANDFDIRLLRIPRLQAGEPVQDFDAEWVRCDPQSVADFSAVAYFFGRELRHELNLPIELIDASFGGSMIETWIPRDAFLTNTQAMRHVGGFVPSRVAFVPGRRTEPTVLYNTMIAPLVPLAMRGVIWYQGKSNILNDGEYEMLFTTLIEGWRDAWVRKTDNDDTPDARRGFPFYFVQIAPYAYIPPIAQQVREAQLHVLQNVPCTGMVVTTDIGDVTTIHPTNKQDVGKRLALWALAKDYGREHLTYSGPMYKSMRVEGERIRITFDHVDGGLVACNGPLNLWQIADVDRNFVDAIAEIDGSMVVVSAKSVTRPVAVRFAWINAPQPNFFNAAGLPASPFRTDNWPLTDDAE